MQGHVQVIAALNANLKDELTAINQYIVQAEMCEDWGYGKLHDYMKARAIKEMQHAEAIIARILFLEGKPVVDELDKITIGGDVLQMMKNDHELEFGAIKSYNEAAMLAHDLKDHGSEELFVTHLRDEEEHIDWIEAQLTQIDQMGIQNYLVEQLD